MDKRTLYIIITTVLFVLMLGFFEYVHRTTTTEVSDVPEDYLKPVNIKLPTDFISDLEQRSGNNRTQDLGY